MDSGAAAALLGAGQAYAAECRRQGQGRNVGSPVPYLWTRSWERCRAKTASARRTRTSRA
eukprot:2738075-Lingulodinium_polyedra.AAC.1